MDHEEEKTERVAPQESAGLRLRLLVAGAGPLARHSLPLVGDVRIGRSAEAEVQIDDTSVSREHALLRIGEGAVTVEDLGSTNGVWVGNARIDDGVRAPVIPGVAWKVGNVVLLIERGAVPAPAADHAPPRPTATEPAPVVASESMREVYALVDRVAPGNISVLLLGETGVGKEVVARALHARSPRAAGPFVALNCASLAEPLLEAEIFGHEKGAFTGALKAKPGLLETAKGGTVFLDEVGEMPASVQAKLLRVLEERRVQRLGALKPIPIDVRFVTATNRDIEGEVAASRFRRDLFFRLNGVSIALPPLRERKVEIEPLARAFVTHFCLELGRRPEPEVAPETLEALKAHEWPGNIRELRNAIERAVLLCGKGRIEVEHLPPDLWPGGGSRLAASAEPAPSAPSTPENPSPDLRGELKSLEKKRILDALDSCGGNQTRAAKLLGISRRSLTSKLNFYGVPRPRKRVGSLEPESGEPSGETDEKPPLYPE